METRYLIVLAAVIAITGIYALVTMQLLAGGLLIAVILAVVLIARFFQDLRQSLARIEKRLDALEKP